MKETLCPAAWRYWPDARSPKCPFDGFRHTHYGAKVVTEEGVYILHGDRIRQAEYFRELLSVPEGIGRA